MICDFCPLRDGICRHLKELMKHTLRNSGIDGSQLCPLVIASAKPVTKETPPGHQKQRSKV